MFSDDNDYHKATQAAPNHDIGYLSKAEIELIKKHRQSESMRMAYNRGVQDCVNAVRLFANDWDRPMSERLDAARKIAAHLATLIKAA